MNIDLEPYKEDLERSQREVSEQIGEKNALEEILKGSTQRVEKIEELIQLYERTAGFLQKVSDCSREQVKDRIEFLVSEALRAILKDDTLEFKVNFEIKRNTIQCDFVLYDTLNKKELDLLNSFGGGVIDIVSIALRFIFSELYRPKPEGPIVLDEVGKFISDDFQEDFGGFLNQLSRKLGRQIILVTHKEGVQGSADKVIRVKKEKNESVIEEV